MKAPSFLRPLTDLSRRLLVGMGLTLFLFSALGAFSYHNLQKQAEASQWVGHTYQVATVLQAVLSGVQDTDSAQRLFMLSGAPAPLNSFENNARALPGELDHVGQLVSDSLRQTARLQTLRAAVNERLDKARARITQRQQIGAAALEPKFLSSNTVNLMSSIRSQVQTMIDEENSLLETRLAQLRTERWRSVLIQSLGGLLSLALLAGVFSSLIRQISRANHAERETRFSNAQLENANAELRAFSYSVAHDLRAPLRAINGFAQVLEEDHAASLPADARQSLGRITANASKMDHLIDDLLALSKVSMQSLHTGRVEMTELVRSVYQEVLETQQDRRVDCRIALLPPATGDPSLLRQVWYNLIGNALKFTQDRSEAHIEIGGNVAGPEFATYFIRDNGAGFDMRYADKLFGAFQRLHRPTDFEGTGIGLALVHRIVHRHGGTIWAEGEENKGAFFAFTLPEWNGG